jgi:hypothetical protein
MRDILSKPQPALITLGPKKLTGVIKTPASIGPAV